ncbi:MAG: hypothetical protein EA365_02085 [Gloeocapsa sp. DLM2.Bin57]|nr:MAG: hypothetical protein EA365_02085 [Gloeocapsa sp. DLM2.Bin57]
MLLEDYFTFLAADDLRVKGTRIGIETMQNSRRNCAYLVSAKDIQLLEQSCYSRMCKWFNKA